MTAPVEQAVPSRHPVRNEPLGSARRGQELLAQLHGRHAAAALCDEMQDIAPAFVDMTIERYGAACCGPFQAQCSRAR